MGGQHPPGDLGGSPASSRPLTLTILLTAGIMLVEAVGGVLSGSLSLLSDAGHMLTDVLALGMSLFAVVMACRPATSRKTYGYHRIEILAALTNGVVLVVIALAIFLEAVRRLADPPPVEGSLMLGVALAGLAANLAGLLILSRGGRGINVRSARLHLMGDALSSVGVLAAALVITATSWYRADPLISLLIGVAILLGAFRIIRETVDILLESTPHGLELREVCGAIESIRGIRGVHDLHIWSITSGMTALSGHVILDGATLEQSDELLNRIKKMLQDRFDIVHTTIQVESSAYMEVGEIH